MSARASCFLLGLCLGVWLLIDGAELAEAQSGTPRIRLVADAAVRPSHIILEPLPGTQPVSAPDAQGQTSWLYRAFRIKAGDRYFGVPEFDQSGELVSRLTDNPGSVLLVEGYLLNLTLFSNLTVKTNIPIPLPTFFDQLASPLVLNDGSVRISGWVQQVGYRPDPKGAARIIPYIILCQSCPRQTASLLKTLSTARPSDPPRTVVGQAPPLPAAAAPPPPVQQPHGTSPTLSPAESAIRGGMSDGQSEVRVVVLTREGTPAAGYHVQLTEDCTGARIGPQATPIRDMPDGSPVGTLESFGRRANVCIVFGQVARPQGNRPPPPTRGNCITRTHEDIARYAKAGLPITLYAEMAGVPAYACPEPRIVKVNLEVEAAAGRFDRITVNDVRALAGEIRVLGQPLENDTLQIVKLEQFDALSGSSVTLERAGWYAVADARANPERTEIKVSLRRTYRDASDLVFRLVTSAGIPQSQCKAELVVPAGQLATVAQGKPALIANTAQPIRLQVSGGTYRRVREPRDTMQLLIQTGGKIGEIKFLSPEPCELNESRRQITSDDLGSGEVIEREVSRNGLVAVTLATVTRNMRAVDAEFLVNVYEDILRAIDDGFVSLQRERPSSLDRSFLIDRYANTRPDSVPFIDEVGETGGRLFARQGGPTDAVNRLLYTQSGRPTPLVNTGIAPLIPAAVQAQVEKYIREVRSYRTNDLDMLIAYLGWSPAEGQSLCAAQNDIRPKSNRLRILAVELATPDMHSKDSKGYRPLDQSRDYLYTCEQSVQSLSILRIVLPAAANSPARRDTTRASITRQIEQLFPK